jgi:integrase/recombinase XerD
MWNRRYKEAGSATLQAESRNASSANELEAMLELHFEALLVKQYSEHTIKARRDQFKIFLRWCTDQGINSPSDIPSALLERYRGYLFYYRKKNGEPLSFRTQHGILVPLKGWLRWMAREKYIVQKSPATSVEFLQARRLCLSYQRSSSRPAVS